MAKEIHATFVETTPRNHRCHNNSRKLVRRWQRPESTVMNVFSVEEVLCSLGMLEAAAKQLPGNYRAAAKQLLGNCGVAIAKQLASNCQLTGRLLPGSCQAAAGQLLTC